MKYPVRSKRRWCRLRGHDWAEDVEVPDGPTFLIYRQCRRCGESEVARRSSVPDEFTRGTPPEISKDFDWDTILSSELSLELPPWSLQ